VIWNGNECGDVNKPSLLQSMKDQTQLASVEYFNYFGSMITDDATRTHEIKSVISMAKAAINGKKALFTSKLDLNLRMKLVKSNM
jgi:hypothetical protein